MRGGLSLAGAAGVPVTTENHKGRDVSILRLSIGDSLIDSQGRHGRVLRFHRDSVIIEWNGLPETYTDLDLVADGIRRCS